jgi:cell division protein FtsI (penicillin-binding protein 3)
MLVLLAARVLELDTVDAGRYASYGSGELYDKVALPAIRGAIYDRSGDLLADSVPRTEIIADDFLVHDQASLAATLAKRLGLPEATLRAELSERNGYVVLATAVTNSVATRLENLGIPGLSFQPTTERVYPAGTLFAPILGSVNAAGMGSSGLEYADNSLLAGSPGTATVPMAPGGIQPPGSPREVRPAVQGTSLVLSVDEPLQYEVEKDLAAQITATRAHSGIAVVSDPRTGDILAMVDLQASGAGVVPASSNTALTSVYEPGSVMKLVTISGALEDRVITPHEELTVPHQIMVGGWPFDDAWWHPTEKMPISEIIAQSSNVGTIEIAHLLGEQRLSYFLHRFGYGQLTGLDWPGESAGILGSPATWSGSAMGSVPIGTDEAVTAVQILDAYNAEADHGVFVPPRLVEATIDPDGIEVARPLGRKHRIISAKVAAEVLPLFEGVVSGGTATAAAIPGYTIAGKTGTAQIPSSTGPGYEPGAWMATFVGFVPAAHPELSAIVVLDQPQTSIYGGSVSAPVFKEIMAYALRHFDIPPSGSGVLPGSLPSS